MLFAKQLTSVFNSIKSFSKLVNSVPINEDDFSGFSVCLKTAAARGPVFKLAWLAVILGWVAVKPNVK